MEWQKEKQRRLERTAAVMRRIAELKIQAHNLKETPEEYVARCQSQIEETLVKVKA